MEIILHSTGSNADIIVTMDKPGEMISRFFLEPKVGTGWKDYIEALQSLKIQFDLHLSVLKLVKKVSSSIKRENSIQTACVIPKRNIIPFHENSMADRERSESLHRLMSKNWERSVRSGSWHGKQSGKSDKTEAMVPDYCIALFKPDLRAKFKLFRPGRIFTSAETIDSGSTDKRGNDPVISYSDTGLDDIDELNIHPGDILNNDIKESNENRERKIPGILFYSIHWPGPLQRSSGMEHESPDSGAAPANEKNKQTAIANHGIESMKGDNK
jgi:hypothetical protein